MGTRTARVGELIGFTGLILLILGLWAHDYKWEVHLDGTYPFRKFAIPLIVVGVVLIVVGLFLLVYVVPKKRAAHLRETYLRARGA